MVGRGGRCTSRSFVRVIIEKKNQEYQNTYLTTYDTHVGIKSLTLYNVAKECQDLILEKTYYWELLGWRLKISISPQF